MERLFKSATAFSVSGSNESFNKCSFKGSFSFGTLQFSGSRSKEIFGKSLYALSEKSTLNLNHPSHFSVHAQASICVGKSMRWWEKMLKPNMVEIHSAQELVDSLLNAGDRLAIIDFYSPGCGGCKTLHPKICQIAETNPNAIFLKVNYEEMRSMCQSLHIHVLPFFRFYRGTEGKLCSFSCTNATIKKFKDALGKYGGTERSTVEPAKGLDDSELFELLSTGQLSKNYASKDEVETGFGLEDDNMLGLEERNAAFVMA